MLKPLKYIVYPPAFTRDMHIAQVSELSFFILLLLKIAASYGSYLVSEVYLIDWVMMLVSCAFGYALYAYYKVRKIGFLTLFISIESIVYVWCVALFYFLFYVREYVGWDVPPQAFFYYWWLAYLAGYVVLFHSICGKTKLPVAGAPSGR